MGNSLDTSTASADARNLLLQTLKRKICGQDATTGLFLLRLLLYVLPRYLAAGRTGVLYDACIVRYRTRDNVIFLIEEILDELERPDTPPSHAEWVTYQLIAWAALSCITYKENSTLESAGTLHEYIAAQSVH